MKSYDEWLQEKTGYECHIRPNSTFYALSEQIDAIVSNIPAYLDEAMAEKDGMKPFDWSKLETRGNAGDVIPALLDLNRRLKAMGK